MVEFNMPQQTFFLLIYGFLAWLVEVIYYSIKEKRFINRGLISLPIDFEIGLVFSNIAIMLPSLGRNYIGMYVLTFGNLVITRVIMGFLGRLITKNAVWLQQPQIGVRRHLVINLVTAAGILIVYLLLQPMLMVLAATLPPLLLTIIHVAAWVLIALDFAATIFSLRRGQTGFEEQIEKGKTDELSERISGFVWKRLDKAYPGIREGGSREGFVFGKGLSLDKLIWVFLISALVGDLIETLYCRILGGTWMSRSSVVFGPFSFVWGIGAVVLTVSLMPLREKNDRWILLAGAILGGVFEYMCSVFTEIMFGKVFWDYSHMPLNIGGRTNLLYMFFWGILGLVWVKMLYPPLEKFIEKFPPIAAKVVTWLVIVLMAFNGLFTVAVLTRYNERQVDPNPSNILETFIDKTYDDEFVEHRWQNMSNADKSAEQ